MTESKFLQNKVALITGGAGGIGWGIGMEFAREGAQVAIVDIDKRNGEDVFSRLQGESDGHLFLNQDIRDLDSHRRLVDEIESKLGPVNILVNNAGVNSEHGFLDMTPEAWDRVFNTNLRAHVFLSQLASQRMIKRGDSGVILFITSVHQDYIQGHPHYSSSKAAIKLLIKEMAVELAPHNIRVLGIAPGGIYINKRTEDPKEANLEPTVLLGGRNGIPRDIGRAAVFLCSDYWARHITGEVLTVSGGQYMATHIK